MERELPDDVELSRIIPTIVVQKALTVEEFYYTIILE